MQQIWRRRPGSSDVEAPGGTEGAGGVVGAALEIIADSRYLKAIGAVILLSSLATTVEAWQFKAIAKNAIPDTEQLAMFFGTFNMVGGVVSLVLQLVLTGRACGRVASGSRCSSSRSR